MGAASGGRAGEKAERALEGRGCLGDAGRALRGGEAGRLLNDKSAGHGWGPAPRGGEEAGGAGLRAGAGADGQAARDGSQVRVSALQGGPAQAKRGARGERVRVPGQWPLRPVPRRSVTQGRPGGGGPTRAEIGVGVLPDPLGAEEKGAAPRLFPPPPPPPSLPLLPFSLKWPLPHFLPFGPPAEDGPLPQARSRRCGDGVGESVNVAKTC